MTHLPGKVYPEETRQGLFDEGSQFAEKLRRVDEEIEPRSSNDDDTASE